MGALDKILSWAVGRGAEQPPTRHERREAQRVLEADVAAGYRPSLPGSLFWDGASATPSLPRMLQDVEAMLAHPRVAASLGYYTSGIAHAVFELEDASTPEHGAFVLTELARFWERGRAVVQCPSYAYGRGAFELVYSDDEGPLRVARVNAFAPLDGRVLTVEGEYAGVRVSGLQSTHADLWGPGHLPAKAFWHAHARRYNRWYGWPQLYPAWRPWRRLAGRDGAEDVVDGGVYRFAYAPPVGRFPLEEQYPNKLTGTPGRYESNRDKMRHMLESLKAGGVVAMPSTVDPESKQYRWDVQWPEGTLDVSGLLEYTDRLEKAISLGVGVPPELLEASEVGSGYSGRAIPMEAFYAQQQRNAEELLESWTWQVGLPLLRWNYGPQAWARVKCQSLLKARRAGRQQGPQKPEQPGQPGQPGQDRPPGEGRQNGRDQDGNGRPPGGNDAAPRRRPAERYGTLPGEAEEGRAPRGSVRLIAEILHGLYGDNALAVLKGADQFAWDESLHPRDRKGRWVRRGSPEAVGAARRLAGAAIRGELSTRHARELTAALGLLTVKQLREAAAEHGKKVPKMLKQELHEAVMALLAAGERRAMDRGMDRARAAPHNRTREQWVSDRLADPEYRKALQHQSDEEFVKFEKNRHAEGVKKALAAGKDVPAAVLADYPDLAPKAGGAAKGPAALSPEEARRELAKAMALRQHNPRNYSPGGAPQLLDAARAAVSRGAAGRPGLRPRLHEVYAEMKEARPDLTPRAFAEAMLKLHQDGRLRLHPYTGPTGDLSDPEAQAAIPYGSQVLLYAEPLAGRPEAEAEPAPVQSRPRPKKAGGEEVPF